MYDKQNIFARIIRGELPCNKIYEDASVLAFTDITPAAPVHVLVVPKQEYSSFHDFTTLASPEEIGQFFTTVRKIAGMLKIDDAGYRIITNHGPDASQSVPHFHVHILAGRQLGELLPGRYEQGKAV